jgi:CubicO group peptidase (beta-lactamase class C family)
MSQKHLRTLIFAAAFSGVLGFFVHAADAPPLPTADPVTLGFSPDRLEKMHDNLRRIVDEGRASGYVTLLARDGRILDWRAHGWRDIEARAPMERDTIMRIHSMTKLVTATAVLALVEDGKLQLDDRVEQYLPELKDRQVMVGGSAENPSLVKAESAVTIRQLLCHTSGYIYDFGGKTPLERLYEKAKIWEASSLSDFVTRVAALPLSHQPGEEFRYGISIDILGAVVEKVSQQRFERFIEERITAPLRMTDTSFDVPPHKRTRLAKIYKKGEGGRLVEVPDAAGTLASGGGGLFSTTADYARFAQMLLNGGRLDGARILSRKTVELMTQNQLSGLKTPHHAYNESRGFGLGPEVMIDLSRSPTLGSLGQFGWYGVATTYCQIDPKERLVALAFFQHRPMNEPGVFNLFANGYYSALVD